MPPSTGCHSVQEKSHMSKSLHHSYRPLTALCPEHTCQKMSNIHSVRRDTSAALFMGTDSEEEMVRSDKRRWYFCPPDPPVWVLTIARKWEVLVRDRSGWGCPLRCPLGQTSRTQEVVSKSESMGRISLSCLTDTGMTLCRRLGSSFQLVYYWW